MRGRQWRTIWPRVNHLAGSSHLRHCVPSSSICPRRWPYLHARGSHLVGSPGTLYPSHAFNENALLKRTINLGIESLEQLQAELQSLLVRGHIHQPVELPNFRGILELWCIVLDIRCDRYGPIAAQRVFYDLAKLCPDGIPCDGFEADRLWRGFITAGSHDMVFLKKICSHELEAGAPRQHFILEVCTSLLKGPTAPLTGLFGAKLSAYHQLDDHDLFEIFRAANKLESNVWLRCVRDMNALFRERNLYDKVIQYLTVNNQMSRAWNMHRFFLSMGDLPMDFKSLIPLIRTLAIARANDTASTKRAIKSFADTLRFAGASFEGQIQRCFEDELSIRTGFSTTNLNIVSSRTLGMRPQSISDEFAARAFSTLSFSFDFMLNALHLLGLVAIGPLTMRQIALSGEKPNEIKRRLAKLENVGIDTGSTAYVRLVRHLATKGKGKQLAVLLQSDQHPEVFDDISTQKKLLSHYLSIGDHTSINQTMMLLDLHNSSNHLVDTPLRTLFNCALKAQNLSTVCSLWHLVFSHDTQEREKYVRDIRNHLRPRMRPLTARSSEEATAALDFAVSVAQNVAPTADHLELKILNEAMVRFGMMGEYESAEKIAVSLASKLLRSEGASQLLLSSIFLPATQRAMVSWSFCGHTPEHNIATVPTAEGQSKGEKRPDQDPMRLQLRGVRLLLRLAREYGVEVNVADIHKEFTICLRNLFSQGTLDPRGNRQNRKEDRKNLGRYLSAFNGMWGYRLTRLEMDMIAKKILRPSATDWYARSFGLEELPISVPEDSAQPSEDNVVVYRDLFTTSWEDYKER